MVTHEDLIDLTSKFSDQNLGTSHGDNQTDTSYLPLEIIQQILSRLPLKYVLRFRIVSKSWNTMISELRFSRVYTNSSDDLCNCVVWQSHVSAARRRKVPSDYSDITIDHSDWKALLPDGKQQVFWESASMGFSLEPRTGKNCFMVGAGSTCLKMSWGENSKRKWKRAGGSRLQAVPKNSKNLFIRGVLKVEMLSPDTFYAAYLVFKFYDGINRQIGQVAVSRGDGWMELEIGELCVTKGDNRDIEAVVLLQTKGYDMSRLNVYGIEFRPSGTPITPVP